MSETDFRIALLIDADNAPSGKIDLILSELAKYGIVNIRRAYGNWKNPGLQGWESVLHEYAIRPIQQFDYTKGKNATDVALVIDAMDLLYTQKLDAFCIVSSDCDFTPLIMRILTSGFRVYGFGEKKTPLPFVSACSKFTYLEALGNGADRVEAVASTFSPVSVIATSAVDGVNVTTFKKTTNELKGDAKLIQLLRNAIDANAGDDGWAFLGAVGHHISNQTSFDSRNYGFKKLSDLVVACELFDVERRNGQIYVRDKRSGKKAQAQGELNAVVLALSLQERYRRLLTKKNWPQVPKASLLAFHLALCKATPGSSKEIMAECSRMLSQSMSLDEVESAFGVFWKAKLFDIVDVRDSSFGLKKTLRFQGSKNILRRIDDALLSRLLSACRETGAPVEVREIKPLLYYEYEDSVLDGLVGNLLREIENKD